MIDSGTDFRTRFWIVFWLGLLTSVAGSAPSLAAECPGHPGALGVSRTIVVDPREHPRIGTMQYRETLPLRDHEVVLTFDDGPLPKYSNQVLRILADDCIKATFFTIGSQARANPEGVRKLVAAGHTVGTHSQNHPLTFQKMPIEKAKAEIEAGIASTSAAMTDPSALAPFFRIPGLLRATSVEDYLASRGLQVWSADFPADDWRHIPPDRVYQLAMQRLEAKGKGILLLHDIQRRTAEALPKIIRELKARGFHIVHVVPATADRPATPTEPAQWLMHPGSELVSIVYRPNLTQTLPAPALSDLNLQLPSHFAPTERQIMSQASGATLPVPGPDLFKIPEGAPVLQATMHARRAKAFPRRVSADSGSLYTTPIFVPKGKGSARSARSPRRQTPYSAQQTTGSISPRVAPGPLRLRLMN